MSRIEGCKRVATCRATRALLGMASPPLCSMTSSSCSNANPIDRAAAVSQCRSCPRLERSFKTIQEQSRAIEGNHLAMTPARRSLMRRPAQSPSNHLAITCSTLSDAAA